MHKSPVTVISASGDLDMRQTRELVKTIDQSAERGERRFVIEWSGVDYIDPLAIGLLLRRQRDLLDVRGAIKFASMTPLVREIFLTYRVDDLFDSFLTIVDALESFDDDWRGSETNH